MKLDINNRSIRLICLFLATDIVLIILHIIYKETDFISNPLFSVEKDRGYAELFQYVKEYWIALLLALLAVQKRSFLYLGWSLLFFYVLLDDALSIHEKWGDIISNKLGILPALNLAADDFGEIIVSVFFGLIFLSFIGIAYRFSDRASREISRYLIVMLFALASFGIAVDLVHEAVNVVFRSRFLGSLLGLIEDGGEMVVMSIIAAFVFLVPDHSHRNVNPLKQHHPTVQGLAAKDNHS